MVDPADFTMPEPQPDKTPAGGGGVFKHLPAVLQHVCYGPGQMGLICVAQARIYYDDVHGRQQEPRDGEQA